jgi:parvulin-like peptidyl-prolyl isomerase
LKRYLLAAAAAAIIAAGCSGGADVAATVNGTEIAADDVEALVYELGEDFGDAEFIQLLDILIQWNAIEEAAKSDFGIDPTDEEIAAEVQRIYAEQGAGIDFEAFLEAQNISAPGLDQYAAQLLIGAEILAELESGLGEPTEEDAVQLLADDPNSWTEVCAAHILVATTEEATAVLDRLAGGEEFAAVAIEASLDTGSGARGGELGCNTPATYVPEFAAATMTADLGEVVGPVETTFGFHLIRVDSRTEATTEELIGALANLQISDAVDQWYAASVGGAEVDVAEEWGTWQTDPVPGIVPPPTLVP